MQTPNSQSRISNTKLPEDEMPHLLMVKFKKWWRVYKRFWNNFTWNGKCLFYLSFCFRSFKSLFYLYIKFQGMSRPICIFSKPHCLPFCDIRNIHLCMKLDDMITAANIYLDILNGNLYYILLRNYIVILKYNNYLSLYKH